MTGNIWLLNLIILRYIEPKNRFKNREKIIYIYISYENELMKNCENMFLIKLLFNSNVIF